MSLYVIYSEAIDKYYIGITEDLQNRLIKHNTHAYSGSYTKAANVWQYQLTYRYPDKERAIYLERFIKRMKNRKFIQKIIENPTILNAL